MSIDYHVAHCHPPLSSELLDLLSQTETATIGHVEHVGFVGDAILPVFPTRVAGQALTVAAPGRDGTVIYKAIDLMQPGDIMVISRVDRDDIACVGGGVALAARARGAAGIVIDGPATDLEEIMAVGLPVWCRGRSSRTSNRQIAVGWSINVPVACGAAAVLPGYAVLADQEGVFVAERHRMEALALLAIERQKRSVRLRSHLAEGRSIFEFDREQTT
ncbi:RraA family protein (plasmid) [Rhizobium sp. WL3]|uniref:RraA family protein n=1 Tax=Rhizobium sp. WL3 TaxID=2603277 RepID=UPI0011C2066F|nr:RraA family protein [Rhizobium sp. WL3]QEE43385.1 RraA family protein [Rhizobium sp. WL3]